ncbi:MAG: hypothetical protein ACMUIP_00570 [bacterium]
MSKNLLKVLILLMSINFLFVISSPARSLAIFMTVDENIGEYDSYDFLFVPIPGNNLSFDFTFTTDLDPGDSSVPFAFPDSFYCTLRMYYKIS